MPCKRLSDTARRLSEKWLKQENRPALTSISIDGLRGFHGESIEFKYPVTAIAGKNGSGKSTILGVAACAYHQDKTKLKFIPPYKSVKMPYYTFNEFRLLRMSIKNRPLTASS